MRVARAIQSGRGQASLTLYGPNNVFARKLAANAALATDQTPALKLANQLSYGNSNYSYDGSTAPSFYGYSGLGYGGWSNGSQTIINYKSFTMPLYVVDNTVPNQTVTYVNYAVNNGNSAGTNYLNNVFTVQPAGAANNLQNYFNAVPVPDVTKIPQGQIQAVGTDGHAVIWRPSTDEMWEMWRFTGTPGSYNFGYGGYIPNVSTWNGIFTNGWGARACGLGAVGGLLTIQDIIDVLRGGSINHAMAVAIPVTANSATAPATRHDSMTHTPQFEADGTTANPAFGSVDAVSEGTFCRFPASFNPVAAMPGAGPVALAIATAIRDYGLVVIDSSGTTPFFMEDARVLGSPYSYAKVNPFAGSTGTAAGFYDAYINNNPGVSSANNTIISVNWADSTLAKMTEITSNTSGMLSKIPWNQLQQLQPFSS